MNLPIELINKILCFRPTHPVANIIKLEYNKYNKYDGFKLPYNHYCSFASWCLEFDYPSEREEKSRIKLQQYNASWRCCVPCLDIDYKPYYKFKKQCIIDYNINKN